MTKEELKEWEQEFDDKISPIFYKINKEGGECTENKYLVKDFIEKTLDLYKKELVATLQNKFIEILKTEANTPLNERKNGWDKTIEIKDDVIKIINEK